MTPNSAGEVAGRSARRWWALAAVLLMIGSTCAFFGLRQTQHPLAGPVVSHASHQGHTAPKQPVKKSNDVASKVAPLVAVRSTPVELRIPALALTVSLSTLGLNPNGTVQVPTDIQQPGWYRFGPSPGQEGSAVILGHVDSYQGPAVFFSLRSLVAGDAIYVTLADGVTAQFKVTSVAMYLKSNFPDQAVYASKGFSALQLVTCAGAFDTQTGHYLSNIVVYSSLVALTPAAVVPATSVVAPQSPTDSVSHS
jgi:LPXTG-site transpeptidase (sortase) family protein